MTEPVENKAKRTYTLPDTLVKLISSLCKNAGYKILKDTTQSERSYTEEGDNSYYSDCCHCGRTFTGPKRMPTCKVCQVKPVDSANETALSEMIFSKDFSLDDLYTAMSKIDDNWNAYGRSRDVAVALAYRVMKDALTAQEASPVVMQYLSLTDVMGYIDSDNTLSPEEYAAELKTKAQNANPELQAKADLYEHLVDWLTQQGLLHAQFCRPNQKEETADWWILRKVYAVSGDGCVGYGKSQEQAIENAFKGKGVQGTEEVNPYLNKPVTWTIS